MEKEYEILSDLQTDQAEDLLEFLGSRMETSILKMTVQEKSRPVGIVYRGINFRKKELQVGQIYRHWNDLSSWSKNQEIAIGFALDDYTPEVLLEEIAIELGYKATQLSDDVIYDEVCQEFVQVVFRYKDGYGFDVNKFVKFERFSKEEEVIHFNGEWKIIRIQEKVKDDRTYYEVELEAVQAAVA